MKFSTVRKYVAALCLLLVLTAAGILLSPHGKAFAQGVATVVGQIYGVNQFQNSSATGLAGAVTNPSSNFVVQVAGGQIYCAGAVDSMAQQQLTLNASNTYLIVYNCLNAQVYAKQAVTAPGNGAGIANVGIPTSLLFAVPNVEVALATVVCNATACGNGGNGSITDNRSLANFPAGLYVSGHVNTASANKDIAGVITLSAGAATLTFTNAFQAAPACVGTDQTAANAVKISTTTTAATFAGTTTDVIAYACYGNPN